MKHLIMTILFLCPIIYLAAQENIEGDISALMEENQYDAIIEKYGSVEPDTLSANALTDIAVAYMFKDDYDSAIEYLDLSIAKDSLQPAPYYTKGMCYLYTERVEESIDLFRKTIMLSTDDKKKGRTYHVMGIAYSMLEQYDEAVEAYQKSLEGDPMDPETYLALGSILVEMSRDEEALATYYAGINVVSEEEVDYRTLLFNAGLMEQLNGNIDAAKSAFDKLIEIEPEDYHAYSKLIQIHNHNEEYDQAQSLKKILYDAHEQDLLPEHMSDMFCIDQFVCNGKSVQAYERYQSGSSIRIYNKIIFYIFNEEGEIEYSIQTEYSPVAVSLGEGTYILCAWKDDAHLNYGIGFTDEDSYKSIKNTVLKIITEDMDKAAVSKLAP